MQPKIAFALFCSHITLLAHVQPLTTILRYFSLVIFLDQESCNCAPPTALVKREACQRTREPQSAMRATRHYGAHFGNPCSKCRTLHLSLLNFILLFSAPCSGVNIFLNFVRIFQSISCPTQFCVICKSLHSPIQLINKNE